MQSGFCVAGVDEESGRWIRPVRPSGHVAARDLQDAASGVVQPLDLVEFELIRAKPSRPHVEDWIANFNRRLVIQQRPDEGDRLAMLERLAEASPASVLASKQRSLVMVEPASISARFVPPTGDRPYQARISFALAGTEFEGELGQGYPCTDLRLRSWGRRFPAARTLSDPQLREALGVRRIFLAIGLSREFQGNYWPMVVGFHTCPDFDAEIDLARP